MVEVRTLRTPGLGDSSHLLVHDGLGLLVDPQRDVERFLEAVAGAGVELRWVLDTHVHNDYVSGAREVARLSGAELVLPAAAGAAYPHTQAFHLEELVEGGVSVRPIHTPGHTPEHTSYLVVVDGQDVALFSGGSLLVADAGRTDLLGERRAAQLAAAQYGSVRRLAALPGDVGLYPTHGQGSFCTASSDGGGSVTSTIAAERAGNHALAHAGVAEFQKSQLEGLQPYPRYYAHMAPINIDGPEPMPRTRPAELTGPELARVAGDVTIVDARPRAVAGGGLVPGSVAVELSEQFAVWVGWLLPFDTPLALVLTPEQFAREAVVQLARIGFDRVEGVLRDPGSWPGPLVPFELVDVEGAVRLLEGGANLLDVRAPGEWSDGRVDEAVRRYLPDLVDGAGEELAPAVPIVVACASGYRSAMAASLLLRHGLEPVVLDGAGMPELAKALTVRTR
jgi:glyoxylase-like metal-dependent hydrolase (beta-lactamase superfamily II)/rhodanese-related sulfurtransferase